MKTVELPFQFVVTIPAPSLESRDSELFAMEIAEESLREAISKSFAPVLQSATVEWIGDEHAKQFHADYGVEVDVGLDKPARIYSDGTWGYPADTLTTQGVAFIELAVFVVREMTKQLELRRMKGGKR